MRLVYFHSVRLIEKRGKPLVIEGLCLHFTATATFTNRLSHLRVTCRSPQTGSRATTSPLCAHIILRYLSVSQYSHDDYFSAVAPIVK